MAIWSEYLTHLKFSFRFSKSLSISTINDENYSINSWEVVFPNPTSYNENESYLITCTLTYTTMYLGTTSTKMKVIQWLWINVKLLHIELQCCVTKRFFWKLNGIVILSQIVMVSPGIQSPNSKKQGVLNWKCLDLYVTRQFIWRQTPKLFITLYWN